MYAVRKYPHPPITFLILTPIKSTPTPPKSSPPKTAARATQSPRPPTASSASWRPSSPCSRTWKPAPRYTSVERCSSHRDCWFWRCRLRARGRRVCEGVGGVLYIYMCVRFSSRLENGSLGSDRAWGWYVYYRNTCIHVRICRFKW